MITPLHNNIHVIVPSLKSFCSLSLMFYLRTFLTSKLLLSINKIFWEHRTTTSQSITQCDGREPVISTYNVHTIPWFLHDEIVNVHKKRVFIMFCKTDLSAWTSIRSVKSCNSTKARSTASLNSDRSPR